MIFSIYLHKPIAETLMCYGNLSDVVNRILDASEEGAFDIIDKPRCPARDGAVRYNIDVMSEYYLTMLENFPINSPRISLRRILYWFVEQEMYDVLEWEVTSEYRNSTKEKLLKKLDDIISKFGKLYLSFNSEEKDFTCSTGLKENLTELRNLINDGR